MADIYLHARLVEDVVDKMSGDIRKDIAILGAQGPDPLYYSMFHKNFSTYKKYADDMHRYDTGKLLINMTNYVKEHYNKETYSFLVGFISHYALDVKIHPYVYYNVGIFEKDKPETHPWRGLHLKFERSIDAAMIEKELGIPSRKIKLTKNHFTIKHISTEIKELFKNTLQNQYNEPSGDIIYTYCIKEMYNSINRIITDRFGIKKQVLKIGNLFTKSHDMILSDLSFFNHTEKVDYLNIKKNTWHHPITNKEYNYSVIELYDQAITFANEMISKVTDYILKNKDIDLTEVFTNLSYNSGLPCDHTRPFKYFNIYRK